MLHIIECVRAFLSSSEQMTRTRFNISQNLTISRNNLIKIILENQWTRKTTAKNLQ